MDAAGGGVLRRSRAAPGSAGERWLVAKIVSEVGSPWIGKFDSFRIPFVDSISVASWVVGCACCFKTGCCFVADVSLFSQRLRNSFVAAETFLPGTLFLKRP